MWAFWQLKPRHLDSVIALRNRRVAIASLKIIDTMMNGGRSIGAKVVVFHDCYYIACDFSVSSFKRYNREANKFAHEIVSLARFSLTLDWFEKPLSVIVPFLMDDITIISNE